jgi:hypothetical protein
MSKCNSRKKGLREWGSHALLSEFSRTDERHKFSDSRGTTNLRQNSYKELNTQRCSEERRWEAALEGRQRLSSKETGAASGDLRSEQWDFCLLQDQGYPLKMQDR